MTGLPKKLTSKKQAAGQASSLAKRRAKQKGRGQAARLLAQQEE